MINEYILRNLYDMALSAADPAKVIADYLPIPTSGRTFVIGAGKAAASMAQALENNWDNENHPLTGMVITRYDHSLKTKYIKVVEASHPVPDETGAKATRDILMMLKTAKLTKDDLVICLISGGGSSLLSMPAPCLSFEEKQNINKQLLKSGANISDMNCVRKHLSSVKGGRLALACSPARLHTLIISDVPGDDPATIASAPTIADKTTNEEAINIIKKYNISVSDKIIPWLENPNNETPKPNHPDLPDQDIYIIASAQTALEAAAQRARKLKITPYILSDRMEGEANQCGFFHASMALQIHNYNQPFEKPCIILSGGETTVTIKDKHGKGGRNTEFLLSTMNEIGTGKKIFGIACDTDGIDGTEDAAGAYFMPDTLEKALKLNIDPKSYLEDHDSYSFFEKTQSLIKTGPTYTNVNDFRAILIT